MPEMPHTLTAALHREEDWFIAQCLEVDVASQGRTIDEALAGLAEAVELYLEEVDDPAGHVTATPLVTSFQLPAGVSPALADLPVARSSRRWSRSGSLVSGPRAATRFTATEKGGWLSSRSTAW